MTNVCLLNAVYRPGSVVYVQVQGVLGPVPVMIRTTNERVTTSSN